LILYTHTGSRPLGFSCSCCIFASLPTCYFPPVHVAFAVRHMHVGWCAKHQVLEEAMQQAVGMACSTSLSVGRTGNPRCLCVAYNQFSVLLLKCEWTWRLAAPHNHRIVLLITL